MKVGDTIEILNGEFSINCSIIKGSIKIIRRFSNKYNNYKTNIEFEDGTMGGFQDDINKYMKLVYINYEIY